MDRSAQLELAPDEVVIGWIGKTPLTRVGWTWIPLTQLVVWGYFTRQAARRSPEGSRFRWSREGFLCMAAMLGSEWIHNLAHLAASNLVDKPMDKMRIQLGMPRCVYHQLNDKSVTPQQHIGRALGGPVVNSLLFPLASTVRKYTDPDSPAGQAARTAAGTNLFLSLISLLPIPGIDGGPLLKWHLVKQGRTIQEADEVVRKVNGPLAIILGLYSSLAFFQKKFWRAAFSLMLGGISLSVFAGWLKEEDVTV